MSQCRQILVLAGRNHAEAMRVAAGLTIFGHQVELIFVDRIVEESEENIAQAELLELSDIEPVSLLQDPNLTLIDNDRLAASLLRADHVISV